MADRGVIYAGRENVKGVELIIEREMKKCVLECYEEPEGILRLKGKHFNISTAVIYGLRAQSTEKEIVKIYCIRGNANGQ